MSQKRLPRIPVHDKKTAEIYLSEFTRITDYSIVKVKHSDNPTESFFSVAILSNGQGLFSANTYPARKGWGITHGVKGDIDQSISDSFASLQRLVELN